MKTNLESFKNLRLGDMFMHGERLYLVLSNTAFNIHYCKIECLAQRGIETMYFLNTKAQIWFYRAESGLQYNEN